MTRQPRPAPPAASIRNSSASLCTPVMHTLAIPAAMWPRSPLVRAAETSTRSPSRSARPSIRSSRSAPSRATLPSRCSAVSTSAAANDTAPATSGVPARRPRSWPPPTISGSSSHPVAHHQHAGAHRRAHLVPGDRHEVVVSRLGGHVDPVHGLDGVGVQKRARGEVPHYPGHFGQRRDRAGLVVDRDHRDHRDVAVAGTQHVSQCLEVDDAPLVHAHEDAPGAFDRIVDRVVLGRGGHRHRSGAPGRHRAPHSHVVGLAASRREHDLAGMGAQDGRGQTASLVQGPTGLPGSQMGSRRVGVMLFGSRQPGVAGHGPQRCRRGVVEIDLRRPGLLSHPAMLRTQGRGGPRAAAVPHSQQRHA